MVRIEVSMKGNERLQAKTSKESTEPSKEKTTPTPSKKEGKSTKSSKDSNKDPNKEKSIEKDKSVDTLDFVDSPKWFEPIWRFWKDLELAKFHNEKHLAQ